MNLAVRVRKRLSPTFALDADFVATPGVTIVLASPDPVKARCSAASPGWSGPTTAGSSLVSARSLTRLSPSISIHRDVVWDLCSSISPCSHTCRLGETSSTASRTWRPQNGMDER